MTTILAKNGDKIPDYYTKRILLLFCGTKRKANQARTGATAFGFRFGGAFSLNFSQERPKKPV